MSLHGQGAHAGVYPGMRMSGPSYYQPGHPKAHRILANENWHCILSTERNSLYPGLGSGFIGWGKEFLRQVGFSLIFNVPKTSRLMYLAGIAQKYYSRQVETWLTESHTLKPLCKIAPTFSTMNACIEHEGVYCAQVITA